MKNHTVTLSDFERREVGQGVYYLSMDAGRYEITIEPHFTAGFTVGIYDKNDPLLSIKKQAVWKFNHPTKTPPERIQLELINGALTIAQRFYDYYVAKTND